MKRRRARTPPKQISQRSTQHRRRYKTSCKCKPEADARQSPIAPPGRKWRNWRSRVMFQRHSRC
jgi:hypothetical protein